MVGHCIDVAQDVRVITECLVLDMMHAGHPVTRSHYIRDDTTGITAPRKGERAKSKARERVTYRSLKRSSTCRRP